MPPRFIFISHSIGSHLVQRGLILRPDILKQTELILHLMPFVRFDPPTLPKAWLSTVASSPDAAIFGLQMVSRMTKSLPRTWIDVYMERMAGVEDAKGRQLAIDIAQQPTFAKNFLMLGTEEIRDIPEVHDEAALRIIGRECSTAMLFCGGPDMWAPESHMDDLKESKRRGTIPPNIHLEYKEELLHGFVVFPTMVEPVVSFCLRAILKTNTIPPPISRL
uniref:AB hydrolase-1 domain-containing protein n=1 Tax=Attheya septentrionalis TaxID=420275 RepID=A0A7S2UIV0_9STRA